MKKNNKNKIVKQNLIFIELWHWILNEYYYLLTPQVVNPVGRPMLAKN